MVTTEDERRRAELERIAEARARVILKAGFGFICLLLIVLGILGAAAKVHYYKRVPISGTGARVMSSVLVFIGLMGLRAMRIAGNGPGAFEDDTIFRALVFLAAGSFIGGFLLFVLSIPF